MMEILHFCPSMSFSGLEQYAFQLALDQKKRGRAVGFVVAPNSRLEKECVESGIITILYESRKIFGTPRFWIRLQKLLIRDKHLKIFHLHSTQEIAHLSLPVLLRKIGGKPFPKIILQIHIWINHSKRDFFHRFLYSIVDEVWCSSVAARGSLIKSLPIQENKIKIVNYGRDLEWLESGFFNREMAREILGLSSQSLILGTVSRLERSKGIKEFIVAAIPLMEAQKELHLAIIGSASPNNPAAAIYEARLKKIVLEFDFEIRNRIHFLGTINDSYRYLKAFDLYVLPSYEETFSLGLLDAQAAELPTVGSDSGGTPEIIREGETGWLFAPKNIDSLRQSLVKALSRRDLWHSYGMTAKVRVHKYFDQKLIFQAVLKEYDSSR